MKKYLAIAVAVLPAIAIGAQEIDIKYDDHLVTGPLSWSGSALYVAQNSMAWEAMKRCPSGFEVKRLYAAPDAEGEWKAGMTVVCLPPGAIPAMPEKPRAE